MQQTALGWRLVRVFACPLIAPPLAPRGGGCCDVNNAGASGQRKLREGKRERQTDENLTASFMYAAGGREGGGRQERRRSDSECVCLVDRRDELAPCWVSVAPLCGKRGGLLLSADARLRNQGSEDGSRASQLCLSLPPLLFCLVGSLALGYFPPSLHLLLRADTLEPFRRRGGSASTPLFCL
uniref:Uncharacterized protein n=1 Tax=Leishmania guyanensis TaxID=5670 RepID=A0A1E1J2P0_LEIGU|nr:Hypothetical protein BN36_3153480 [Leishmania guyanensis]